MSQPSWSVVFAAGAEDDLALIEAFLAASYRDFGEPPDEAARHAEVRIDAIITAAERLSAAWLTDTTGRPVATERVSADWVGR